MLSLMNYLYDLLSRFKKHKGLWFTTITTLSIIGIIVALYIIMSMTSSVSEKVYQSMAKDYSIKITTMLDGKKNEFKKVVSILSENKPLLTQIELNQEQEILASQKAINDSFIKTGINNYKVTFYSVANTKEIFRSSIISVIKSKNTIYGLEVMSDGVFNTYLQPLIKDDNVYGVIEVKESIHNYRKIFESLNDEYVFLLDKKMLPQISIDAKNGKYKDMINEYTVEQTFYDTKFTTMIIDINEEEYKKMIQENYVISGVYYRTYKIMTDINGANIGMVMLGEMIDKEDGFVNLADNMTKTVTTVALGLVISIMLFMF
jgi:hypothetical protein